MRELKLKNRENFTMNDEEYRKRLRLYTVKDKDGSKKVHHDLIAKDENLQKEIKIRNLIKKQNESGIVLTREAAELAVEVAQLEAERKGVKK